MAFIVEKIPEAEIDTLSFVNKKLCSRWVIDREKDVLVALTDSYGGTYEGTTQTDYYTMNWHGEIIEIVASPMSRVYVDRGANMNWKVQGVIISEALKNKREEILQLIRDAFSSIGDAFNRSRFLSVNVEFDLPPSFYR